MSVSRWQQYGWSFRCGGTPLSTETTDHEDAPETARADDAAARPASRTRTRAVLVVALVVTVLAVVAAVSFRQEAAELREERDERRTVADRAGRFTGLLLSYSFTDLAANRTAVLEFATDSFASTYEEAFLGGLDAVITELEATAEARVRDVWVGEPGEEWAPAIVHVDSTIEAASGLRRLVGSYLRLEFAREEGEWKVDQVTHLVADDESLVPPVGDEDASSDPGTTAPPESAPPESAPADSAPAESAPPG